MRNLLSILAAFLFFFIVSLNSSAQSFAMVDSARITSGTVADYSLTNPVQIVNNSSDSLNMAWERFDESMPSAWEISSCTPMGCAPIGVSNGSYVLDPVNSLSDYHNCHFYPNGAMGSGEAKIRIWNTVTLEEAIVTWYAVVGAVGIDEIEALNLSIFPNPGKEITLNGDFGAGDFSISVLGSTGSLVRNINLAGKASITIDDLPSGFYYVQVNGTSGPLLTEKIVITE